MGLFEILGETFNPGKTGSADFNDKHKSDNYIWLRLAVSLILIGLAQYFFFFRGGRPFVLSSFLLGNMFFVIYLIIGYFINIKPNHNNLGWGSFPINNPFRYSDNINRYLVFFQVLFLPAKFVSQSLVSAYLNFSGRF